MKEKRQRVVIISPRQYGYQTDYLKYCEHLPEWRKVCFLTVDQGLPRVAAQGAEVRYVACRVRQLAYAWFFVYVWLYLLLHRGVVMTTNFNGCRFLKRLMPWRWMAVNIRTVAVEEDAEVAARHNQKILRDARVFDRIIMISAGGASALGLPMEKVRIVSLGADVLSHVPKRFDALRLLYVGTLTGRNLLATLEGFARYVRLTGDAVATYDIVGDGEEFGLLAEFVRSEGLAERVRLHGRRQYGELAPFFDACNVGVSFVPMTAAYEYQPPTKTFEYMASGLLTIATRTKANADVITGENGILIEDTAESFCAALQHIRENATSYASEQISASAAPYRWREIVAHQLIKALEMP